MSASRSKFSKNHIIWITLFGLCLLGFLQKAQCEEGRQRGNIDINSLPLKIPYLHYRPVQYETEYVHENENERPNQGGLVFAYIHNPTNDRVELRDWRLNGKGPNYWRMGYRIAWDRFHDKALRAGQTTVVEICGTSDDFAIGKSFEFGFIDRKWRPAAGIRTKLQSDPVRISWIHILPGMKQVEIHLRNQSDQPVNIASAQVENIKNKTSAFLTQTLDPKSNAIITIELARPFKPSELCIAKVTLKETAQSRDIYAHRRAFEDRFPIGTWGVSDDMYLMARRHHIDTIVQGGKSTDSFYSKDANAFGFYSMVHTGIVPKIDMIRDLGDHPAVSCWMIQDEPDWSYTPEKVLCAINVVETYNSTKPTFVTLCRNVKFMEYAFQPDIPCHDHYCVTAPSTSKWPHRYGTRLEETAYYTRDLKYASEPKPIWVWTQGIFDWDQRPKRPVPTPEEAIAQLYFNLSRGAKGILWFTFKKSVGEKYPDLRDCIKEQGRILELIRNDLLSSEPLIQQDTAADKIDVAVLAGPDKAFVFVTNLDYQIDDEAYPFTQKNDISVSVRLPNWIKPKKALSVSANAIDKIPFKSDGVNTSFTLDSLKAARLIIVANNPDQQEIYKAMLAKIIEKENRPD